MKLARDYGIESEQFMEDVVQALSRSPRELPCKYLYDEEGSRLFDQICELDEYYLTRTELSIMRDHISSICGAIGERCVLIEFGSGSSKKTRVLLDHLPRPAAYVPVDICKEHLQNTAVALSESYPGLEILPVCADYTKPIPLPAPAAANERRVVYFPGSTIGNMSLSDATTLLHRLRATAGEGGGLLIGVDLHKDRKTLEAAYDDRDGVTARFELNLLQRMNRELGADFDLTAWGYEAAYFKERKRIEMYAVSLRQQIVKLGSERVAFAEGERVLLEVSHKFTFESFDDLAQRSGLRVASIWTDPDELFSLQYLEVDRAA